MRTSNKVHFWNMYHDRKINNMATETDQQKDALQDEAERVQRVKPQTILRKAA